MRSSDNKIWSTGKSVAARVRVRTSGDVKAALRTAALRALFPTAVKLGPDIGGSHAFAGQ
jgi:hypothetical protein